MTLLNSILILVGILTCIIGWLGCIYILCTRKIDTKKKHDNISLCLMGLSFFVVLYGIFNHTVLSYGVAFTLTALSFLIWKRGETYKALICLLKRFKITNL